MPRWQQVVTCIDAFTSLGQNHEFLWHRQFNPQINKVHVGCHVQDKCTQNCFSEQRSGSFPCHPLHPLQRPQYAGAFTSTFIHLLMTGRSNCTKPLVFEILIQWTEDCSLLESRFQRYPFRDILGCWLQVQTYQDLLELRSPASTFNKRCPTGWNSGNSDITCFR